MKTIHRYLALELYRSIFLILIALLGLYTFFSIIDQLDRLDGVSFQLEHLLLLELLSTPNRLYDLFPIALLVGTTLSLANLAQRHELIILRASGMSGIQILKTLFLVTIPLMAFALLLSEVITPRIEVKLSQAQIGISGEVRRSGSFKSGFWFRETPSEQRLRIINAQALSADGGLKNVYIYDYDNQQQLTELYHADTLTIENQQIQLNNVEIHHLEDLNASLRVQDPSNTVAQLNLEKINQLAIDTTLSPELLLARIIEPERMSLITLTNYINYLSSNNLIADRQIIAAWRKLIYPLTLLVMVTIAAPISFIQTRRGGVAGKMFISILLGVGFFFVNQLALNLGILSRWPAWATAILPNFIAFSGAVIAILIIENQHRFAYKRSTPKVAT